VSDQSLLRYAIVAGNDQRRFSIDPLSGELRIDGWIDFERQPQHVLTIEASDQFAPNPGVLTRTVVIDLVDETSPDATEDLDGNGIFDSWEGAYGLTAADPGSDDDLDGIPLYFEFLSGGDPTLPDPPSLLGLRAEGSDPAVDFGMGWNVRNGFELGLDYQVQHSSTLDPWSTLTPGLDFEVLSVTPIASGISRIVIRRATASDRSFLRLSNP